MTYIGYHVTAEFSLVELHFLLHFILSCKYTYLAVDEGCIYITGISREGLLMTIQSIQKLDLKKFVRKVSSLTVIVI
jgi:hypothetical protein